MRLITGQTSRRAAGPDPERDPNWLFFFFSSSSSVFLELFYTAWEYSATWISVIVLLER